LKKKRLGRTTSFSGGLLVVVNFLQLSEPKSVEKRGENATVTEHGFEARGDIICSGELIDSAVRRDGPTKQL
jgi:hypothetical protein